MKMARIRKSKNNDTYFETIPKKKVEVSRDAEALKKTMTLAKLVRERLQILDESRDIRKQLYNVSKDIHLIETQISDLFMEA